MVTNFYWLYAPLAFVVDKVGQLRRATFGGIEHYVYCLAVVTIDFHNS